MPNLTSNRMSNPTLFPILPDLTELVAGLERVANADPSPAGAEARAQIVELRDAVRDVQVATVADLDAPEARKQAATALEHLAAAVERVEATATRAAVAPTASAGDREVLRGTDLDKVARTLRTLAVWMRDPTTEQRDPEVAKLVQSLREIAAQQQASQDAQQDRDIAATVKQSLAEIFDKPLPWDGD